MFSTKTSIGFPERIEIHVEQMKYGYWLDIKDRSLAMYWTCRVNESDPKYSAGKRIAMFLNSSQPPFCEVSRL